MKFASFIVGAAALSLVATPIAASAETRAASSVPVAAMPAVAGVYTGSVTRGASRVRHAQGQDSGPSMTPYIVGGVVVAAVLGGVALTGKSCVSRGSSTNC